MNEILDILMLDNSLKSLATAGVSIFLILLLRKYLSRPFAFMICGLLEKLSASIDRRELVKLIIRPLGWLITVMATVTILAALNFPEAWKFTVLNIESEKFLPRLGVAIIIISFFRFLLKLVDFAALTFHKKALPGQEQRNEQIVRFTRDFIRIILIIAGILVTLRFGFGYNVSSLLTGLSIAGAALALAAKETIENLISSFIIFIDKPFTAGDLVRVNNITGTVEQIGMRSTRIRTAEKTLVTIPNKQMVDSVVDNWSARTERRGEIRIELSNQAPADKIETILLYIRKKLSETPGINSYSAYFTEFSKGGKTLSAEFFTETVSIEKFNSLKEELNLFCSKMIEAAGLELAESGNIKTTR